MEIRGQRLCAKLPHHQRDLTPMIGRMICQVLHQVCQFDLCCTKRQHLFQRFICPIGSRTRPVLSRLPPTLAGPQRRRGNTSGSNRASRRALRSDKKAGLWDGSFQYASQIHSPPRMCTSVSRTERRRPPRSRVNCSGLSLEAALNTLVFAQRFIRREFECHLWS